MSCESTGSGRTGLMPLGPLAETSVCKRRKCLGRAQDWLKFSGVEVMGGPHGRRHGNTDGRRRQSASTAGCSRRHETSGLGRGRQRHRHRAVGEMLADGCGDDMASSLAVLVVSTLEHVTWMIHAGPTLLPVLTLAMQTRVQLPRLKRARIISGVAASRPLAPAGRQYRTFLPTARSCSLLLASPHCW
ncbi:hypothetical protein NX059_008836 [Plenodomus lindquistii]|nr:hypothetical protein NX059_008836 [Plenodomus lindquistii]